MQFTDSIFGFSLQPVYIVQTLKFVTLFVLSLYAIFGLIIIRQVQLMSRTLITPISPIVNLIAIVHEGFVVGLIVLVFGLF